jgi:hypothetical protein
MKRAEERGEMRASQLMPIALLGMASICCLAWGGCSAGEAAEQVTRPDLVTVIDMALFEEFDRPSVQFPHDLHTDVMRERKEECTICHQLEADGRLSTKYQRLLEDVGEEELVDLYHDNCIGCHQERAMAGEAAGPVACGECHRREPAYVSSRQPFGFDKSLHYRHVKASKDKCDGCHHVYDDAKKELVYIEGEESSCRDCHRERTEENRSAFRVAAHRACIGCHREPPANLEKTDSPGPQVCAGCHDEERQLAIEAVEKPPRLKVKQPDFTLLSASKEELEFSKLRAVPFSHIDHELNAPSCRTCHHETLDRCTECHALKPNDKSGGVTLYEAMHGVMADSSCVGCHATQTAAVECAGCHDVREQGHLLDDGCAACHAGPLPENLESERSQYTSLDDFRPIPPEIEAGAAPIEVPETVTMGALSDEYGPAQMPHRKIVDKLRQYIDDSRVASYFHEDDDAVCRGCHHQSPVGEKPPLCESCHGVESAGSDLLKPGLRGALHRQCLGCHQSMEIQKPSDCFGCHAAKEGATASMTSSAVR